MSHDYIQHPFISRQCNLDAACLSLSVSFPVPYIKIYWDD